MNTSKQPPDFAFSGSFYRDDVEPTCEGLGFIMDEFQRLDRAQVLQTSDDVMTSIWNQRPSEEMLDRPTVNTIASLIDAINKGWQFNANEADFIWMLFGKIVPIVRKGRIVGIGSLAPDGAVIQDGRVLVQWRERKWASCFRNTPQKPHLKLVERI